MADTTTIEALKKKHNKAQNVRKALNVLAFVAPLTTAVPDALTGANGGLDSAGNLHDGWRRDHA